jgi:menaquinol-cytochrome c reductase cytochrome b/c subunit
VLRPTTPRPVAGQGATPAAAAPGQPASPRPATPASAARPAAGTAAARPAAGAAGAAPPRPAAEPRRREERVNTWPNLLMPEFTAAVAVTLGLFVLAILLNAPLEEHSTVSITPNPSKAPWYFLNLQELLLHMHPALAGVIVPTVLILALMAIPYIDTDPKDVGIWFTSPRGRTIAIQSAIFAAVVNVVMIIFDDPRVVGTRQLVAGIWSALGLPKMRLFTILDQPLELPTFINETLIPVILMIGLPYLLIQYYKRRGATVREQCIAFFSGFLATYIVLTLFGTVFRGPAMLLYWPWAMPPRT